MKASFKELAYNSNATVIKFICRLHVNIQRNLLYLNDFLAKIKSKKYKRKGTIPFCVIILMLASGFENISSSSVPKYEPILLGELHFHARQTNNKCDTIPLITAILLQSLYQKHSHCGWIYNRRFTLWEKWSGKLQYSHASSSIISNQKYQLFLLENVTVKLFE